MRREDWEERGLGGERIGGRGWGGEKMGRRKDGEEKGWGVA